MGSILLITTAVCVPLLGSLSVKEVYASASDVPVEGRAVPARDPSRRSPSDTRRLSSQEGTGTPSVSGAEDTKSSVRSEASAVDAPVAEAAPEARFDPILGQEVSGILKELEGNGLDFNPERDLGPAFEAHLRGKGAFSDRIDSYIKAAKADSPQDLAKKQEALAFLGTALKTGYLPAFSSNPNLALRLLVAGARALSAQALNTLSTLYKTGRGDIKPDPQKAQLFFAASIDSRIPGSDEVRSWYDLEEPEPGHS